MYALISHEIGHIWHMSAGGRFHCRKTQKEKAVFQLYSEGVAMWCEQKLCRDDGFYHGHKKDWLVWCKENIMGIKHEYFGEFKIISAFRIFSETGVITKGTQMLDII